MIDVLLVALVLAIGQGCLIASRQIGSCVPTATLSNQLSFCFESLPSHVCVPVDREIWPTYNVSYRDRQVEGIFVENIEARLILEYTQASGQLFLSNNLDCFNSYRSFLCQWNFPQCDPVSGDTLPVCESSCTDYYTNCGQATTQCQLTYSKIDLGFRTC